ncbi:MAG TPA: PilZ domain-containing protein [Candidatus Acidoferrales bacterium]
MTVVFEPPHSKRKYPRIVLPRGMLVAWSGGGKRAVSRVASLSLGGLFIITSNPPEKGTAVKLLFDVPGGEVRARAVVKRIVPEEGMGLQFSNMNYDDRARLNRLLQKLLT